MSNDDLEVTVLLPCLNEAETLEVCVRKALNSLAELGVDGEVLVSDNGSTDGSQQIAREAEENPELVQTSPHTTRLQRLDETTAARKPILRWKAPVAAEPLVVDSAAKEW